MRRPIQLQLVAPMLALSLAAITVTSVVGAWLIGRENYRRHRQAQQRLVATLTEGGFPLNNHVLQRLTGLSGAQFAVLSATGELVAATVGVSPAELARLQAEVAAAEGPREPSAIMIGNDSFLAERLPIRPTAGTDAGRWLVVLHHQDLWWRVGREGVLAPLGVGAAMALAVSVAAAQLARRWKRPIVALRDHTQRIASGQFVPAELPVTDDEIRDLTVAVNRMTQQLAHYEQSVRGNERLRVLGQLGAGVAHQIRNAVTGARLAVDLHTRACHAVAGRESLDVALRQLQLMEDQLDRLLTLGQPRKFNRQALDLCETLDQLVASNAFAMRHAGVRVTWTRPERPIATMADGAALRQALVNLAANAAQAVEETALPEIRFTLTARAGQCEICVADNGPGPAPAVAERMFEPLVTTHREGTGLGLAVARELVEAHNGTIAWRRREGWTEFVVTLSRVEPERSPGAATRATAETADGAALSR